MTQKSYDELTASEKAALFIAEDVYAFPSNDPEVAIDYQGLSGTLTLDQYIDLVNNSTIDLYFKIEAQVLNGDPNAWGGTTIGIGTISAGTKSMYLWQPTRTVPSSKTTETLRLTIKVFDDASETNQIGEDFVDFTYYFFSHTDGTIIDYSDFETDTDGWTGTSGILGRSTDHPYTGAWGIKIQSQDNRETDSSGQKVPSKSYKVYKSFDFSSYSEVFIVFHILYTYYNADTGIENIPPLIRVWTNSSDSIIRINQPRNQYKPYRVAVKIPTSESTINWVTLMQMYGAISDYHSYLDTIIVVGF